VKKSESLVDFYVYLHVFKNGAFYVGKGRGGRDASLRGRSGYWRRVFEKHGAPTIERVCEGLTCAGALDLERLLIALAKMDGATLLNLTNGGEGASGVKFSQTRRENLAAARKLYVATNPDVASEMAARINTPDARRKVTAACRSEEERARRRAWSSLPEHHAHLLLKDVRQRVIAARKTPEARRKTSEILAAQWADEAHKTRRSRAIKAALSDPGRRSRMVAGIKNFWASADREEMSLKMREGRRKAKAQRLRQVSILTTEKGVVDVLTD
jgi:hypothetical protein